MFSARHGDGLYDSYMRTDHILKDEADTNSPPGMPPMPKHTVSTCTLTHTHMHKAGKAIFPVLKNALSPDILFLRDIPHSACSDFSRLHHSFISVCLYCWIRYLRSYFFFIFNACESVGFYTLWWE